MKQRLPLLLFSASLLLSSCGQTPSASSASAPSSAAPEASSSATSSSSAPVVYATPGEELLALRQSHNYTVNVQIIKKGIIHDAVSADYEVLYADHYYEFAYSQGHYGYIEGEEGVYPFSVDALGNLVPGEILTQGGEAIDDIYAYDIVKSFDAFDEKSLSSSDSPLFLSSKKGRLALLEMASLDQTYYASLSEVYASFDEQGRLRIDAKLSNATGDYLLSWTVYDLGSTSSLLVEDFLEGGGGAYVAPATLGRAKELFQAANFTHLYYDSQGAIGGYERFHPDYYFCNYTDAFMEETHNYPIGMCGVSHKKDPATGASLYGCYSVSFAVSSSDLSLVTAVSVSESRAYNTSTSDLSIVMSYPSNLYLWDQLETMTPYESEFAHEGMEEAYVCTKENVVANFVDDFFLSSVLEANGASASAILLETKGMGEGETPEMWFSLIASNGSIADFYFTDFGTTRVQPMEDWFATLVNA